LSNELRIANCDSIASKVNVNGCCLYEASTSIKSILVYCWRQSQHLHQQIGQIGSCGTKGGWKGKYGDGDPTAAAACAASYLTHLPIYKPQKCDQFHLPTDMKEL
jgi:hypothetical protein